MFSIGTHRRFRDQLSAYIDGELEAAAAERLETHLAACEGCRLELEQLRATAAALRDLPEVQAPRSFTLSPERAAARRPLTGATAPLALGMRLAAAGVAVALAAVFVVDLGGLAEDNEAGTTAPQMLADEDAAVPGAEDSAGYATTPEAPSERTSGGAAPAASPSAEGGDSELAQPATGAVETPVAGPEEVRSPLASQEDDDGGIDALTAAEIGLGAALALLVLGGGVLAYAGRKR